MAYGNFITFFFKFICLGQRPRRLLLFLSFIFVFVLIFACQPCAKVNSVSAHSTGKGQVGSPSPTWPAYTLEANFNLRSRKGEVGGVLTSCTAEQQNAQNWPPACHVRYQRWLQMGKKSKPKLANYKHTFRHFRAVFIWNMIYGVYMYV